MVQVLDKIPGFGERIGAGLGGGFGQGFSSAISSGIQHKREKELQTLKLQGKKKEEDVQKFQTGLGTIEAMRQIASKNNIGRGSGFMGFFGGETAKDRAEFEQLGKSLIPLVAAGVPVRNQKEFEEYKKVITNPSSTEGAIEGALNGLERIFSDKISQDETEEKLSKSKKMKFNSGNKEHKAKAEQLFKKLKDKEKVREALRKEFDL